MSLPTLSYTLHDLNGAQLCGAPRALAGSEVTVPLSDSRTGTLVLSMYDPAAAHIAAGSVAVKGYFGDALVLWGIAMSPSFDFDAATITVSIHDPTIRLKKHFMGTGMASVVAKGVWLDGRGVRQIISDCVLPAWASDLDAPLMGILTTGDGQFDWVAPSTSVQAVALGDCAWDVIGSIIAAGVDVEFQPIDSRRPSWLPGQMADVVTYATQGRDRSAGNTGHEKCVKFVYAKGSKLTLAPDMNSVINWAIHTGSGSSSAQTPVRGQAYDNSAVAAYGIYQDWQADDTTGDNWTVQGTLNQNARQSVQSFGIPPNFIELTSPTDQLEQANMTYPYDYAIGDLCQVEAVRGLCSVSFAARLVAITISSVDNDGNCDAAHTFVPPTGIDNSVTVGDPAGGGGAS